MKKTNYESHQVNMRFPVDLLQKAIEKARNNYLTLSQYIFRLVLADIKENNNSDMPCHKCPSSGSCKEQGPCEDYFKWEKEKS